MQHFLEVIDNTREAAEDFLMNVATHDLDFSGENGPEYRWEIAEDYECNADYAIAEAKKEKTTEEMINKFIDTWMGNDYYYDSYDVKVLDLGDKLAISFVYTTSV